MAYNPFDNGVYNATPPTLSDGQVAPVELDVNGNQKVNLAVVSGTLPLPTGAATSANQTNGSQKSQQVDAAGNVQPAGDTPAHSVNVEMTDGTNVLGTSAHPVAVSAASLPLPTGAATAANQATEIASLATLAGGVSGTKYQDNVAQINGTTTSVGTGASDAGTQRVAPCNPVIKTIQVTNPAAGAGWSTSPPSGKQWIIIAASWIFTASGTAANRTPNVFTNTSGNAWFVDLARNVITTGQAPRVNAFAGGQLSTDILSGNLQIFLSLPPGLIIDSNDAINASAANIQTTDQFSNIFLKVIEQ